MGADRSRRPTGGVVAAIVGLALFVYFLQRAGVGEVVEGIRRLGWVFVVVVLLGGVRFLVRAAAWIRCLDGPHRLTLGEVFQAVLVGDALGNVTPLNIIVGEPAKGVFLRHREPLSRTLSALAVENLFYTMTALLVIVCGLIAVVVMFQTSGQLWLTSGALVGVMFVSIGAAHWVLWTDTRLGSASLRWLARRGLAPATLTRLAHRVERLERHVHAIYPRRVARLLGDVRGIGGVFAASGVVSVVS